MYGKWTHTIFKTQMWIRIWMAILGLILAVLLIEVGVRMTYKYLPWPIQQRTSGTRLYALGGPALGSFISDFYK